MNNKYILSIVGPTAIGKTSLSIQLAEAFDTEIISADSRQFYREMQIGTAAPSPEELGAVPHHFIKHISIEENYSVGDFEKEALAKTEELFRKKDILVLVGGSGLYVKSLLEGLNEFPEVAPEIREKLNKNFDTEGLEPLRLQLLELDPEYSKRIDLENPHRVIRALEICIGTGRTFSSFLDEPKPLRPFKVISIGLTGERGEIYERINMRVDQMMEAGLETEAENLFDKRKLNALNTVGYKELFSFFEGKMTREEAVEEIKKNTRRFAKRQLTWFKKDEITKWFDYQVSSEEVLNYVNLKISEIETSSQEING